MGTLFFLAPQLCFLTYGHSVVWLLWPLCRWQLSPRLLSGCALLEPAFLLLLLTSSSQLCALVRKPCWCNAVYSPPRMEGGLETTPGVGSEWRTPSHSPLTHSHVNIQSSYKGADFLDSADFLGHTPPRVTSGLCTLSFLEQLAFPLGHQLCHSCELTLPFL